MAVEQTKKAPQKKSTPVPSSRKPTASARRRPGSKTPVASARSRRPTRVTQGVPTPERYKEIQQALADKGYYKGPVSGEWGPDSVESLKKFQEDQHLLVDGKLGSLSLIALGLGPKRQAPNEAVAPVLQNTHP